MSVEIKPEGIAALKATREKITNLQKFFDIDTRPQFTAALALLDEFMNIMEGWKPVLVTLYWNMSEISENLKKLNGRNFALAGFGNNDLKYLTAKEFVDLNVLLHGNNPKIKRIVDNKLDHTREFFSEEDISEINTQLSLLQDDPILVRQLQRKIRYGDLITLNELLGEKNQTIREILEKLEKGLDFTRVYLSMKKISDIQKDLAHIKDKVAKDDLTSHENEKEIMPEIKNARLADKFSRQISGALDKSWGICIKNEASLQLAKQIYDLLKLIHTNWKKWVTFKGLAQKDKNEPLSFWLPGKGTVNIGYTSPENILNSAIVQIESSIKFYEYLQKEKEYVKVSDENNAKLGEKIDELRTIKEILPEQKAEKDVQNNLIQIKNFVLDQKFIGQIFSLPLNCLIAKQNQDKKGYSVFNVTEDSHLGGVSYKNIKALFDLINGTENNPSLALNKALIDSGIDPINASEYFSEMEDTNFSFLEDFLTKSKDYLKKFEAKVDNGHKQETIEQLIKLVDAQQKRIMTGESVAKYFGEDYIEIIRELKLLSFLKNNKAEENHQLQLDLLKNFKAYFKNHNIISLLEESLENICIPVNEITEIKFSIKKINKFLAIDEDKITPADLLKEINNFKVEKFFDFIIKRDVFLPPSLLVYQLIKDLKYFANTHDYNTDLHGQSSGKTGDIISDLYSHLLNCLDSLTPKNDYFLQIQALEIDAETEAYFKYKETLQQKEEQIKEKQKPEVNQQLEENQPIEQKVISPLVANSSSSNDNSTPVLEVGNVHNDDELKGGDDMVKEEDKGEPKKDEVKQNERTDNFDEIVGSDSDTEYYETMPVDTEFETGVIPDADIFHEPYEDITPPATDDEMHDDLPAESTDPMMQAKLSELKADLFAKEKEIRRLEAEMKADEKILKNIEKKEREDRYKQEFEAIEEDEKSKIQEIDKKLADLKSELFLTDAETEREEDTESFSDVEQEQSVLYSEERLINHSIVDEINTILTRQRVGKESERATLIIEELADLIESLEYANPDVISQGLIPALDIKRLDIEKAINLKNAFDAAVGKPEKIFFHLTTDRKRAALFTQLFNTINVSLTSHIFNSQNDVNVVNVVNIYTTQLNKDNLWGIPKKDPCYVQKQNLLKVASELATARGLQPENPTLKIIVSLVRGYKGTPDQFNQIFKTFEDYLNILNNDQSLSYTFVNELISYYLKNVNSYTIHNKVLEDGSKLIHKNTPTLFARAIRIGECKSYNDKNAKKQRIHDKHARIIPQKGALTDKPDLDNKEIGNGGLIFTSELAVKAGARAENPFLLIAANRHHRFGGADKGSGSQEEALAAFSSNAGVVMGKSDEIKLKYRLETDHDTGVTCLRAYYRQSLTHDPNNTNAPYSLYGKNITVFAQANNYAASKEHQHALSQPYEAGMGFIAAFDLRRPEHDERSLMKKDAQGNVTREIDWARYASGTEQKLRHIFNLAKKYGHKTVIMSAFGCFAFTGNQKEKIFECFSRVYAKLAAEYRPYFDNIVLAEPANPKLKIQVMKATFNHSNMDDTQRKKFVLNNIAYIMKSEALTDHEKIYELNHLHEVVGDKLTYEEISREWLVDHIIVLFDVNLSTNDIQQRIKYLVEMFGYDIASKAISKAIVEKIKTIFNLENLTPNQAIDAIKDLGRLTQLELVWELLPKALLKVSMERLQQLQDTFDWVVGNAVDSINEKVVDISLMIDQAVKGRKREIVEEDRDIIDDETIVLKHTIINQNSKIYDQLDNSTTSIPGVLADLYVISGSKVDAAQLDSADKFNVRHKYPTAARKFPLPNNGIPLVKKIINTDLVSAVSDKSDLPKFSISDRYAQETVAYLYLNYDIKQPAVTIFANNDFSGGHGEMMDAQEENVLKGSNAVNSMVRKFENSLIEDFNGAYVVSNASLAVKKSGSADKYVKADLTVVPMPAKVNNLHADYFYFPDRKAYLRHVASLVIIQFHLAKLSGSVMVAGRQDCGIFGNNDEDVSAIFHAVGHLPEFKNVKVVYALGNKNEVPKNGRRKLYDIYAKPNPELVNRIKDKVIPSIRKDAASDLNLTDVSADLKYRYQLFKISHLKDDPIKIYNYFIGIELEKTKRFWEDVDDVDDDKKGVYHNLIKRQIKEYLHRLTPEDAWKIWKKQHENIKNGQPGGKTETVVFKLIYNELEKHPHITHVNAALKEVQNYIFAQDIQNWRVTQTFFNQKQTSITHFGSAPADATQASTGWKPLVIPKNVKKVLDEILATQSTQDVSFGEVVKIIIKANQECLLFNPRSPFTKTFYNNMLFGFKDENQSSLLGINAEDSLINIKQFIAYASNTRVPHDAYENVKNLWGLDAGIDNKSGELPVSIQAILKVIDKNPDGLTKEQQLVEVLSIAIKAADSYSRKRSEFTQNFYNNITSYLCVNKPRTLAPAPAPVAVSGVNVGDNNVDNNVSADRPRETEEGYLGDRMDDDDGFFIVKDEKTSSPGIK